MTDPVEKGDRRKQTIIATASVLGLLVTYLLYKHSRATATGGTTALPTGGIANDPNSGAQPGGTNGGLSDQLSALVAALTPSTSTPDPGPSNAPYYKRFVNAPVGGGIHGTVYEFENGKAIGLSNQAWAALGSPSFQSVTTSDSDYALIRPALPNSVHPSTPVVHPMAYGTTAAARPQTAFHPRQTVGSAALIPLDVHHAG